MSSDSSSESDSGLKRINKFCGEDFGLPNKRTIFAGASHDSQNKPTRVIFLVGSAKSSKNRFIDQLCNYFYGTKLGDDFRYNIANEKFGASTPEKSIISYVFNETQMPFRPIIVDTPEISETSSEEAYCELIQKWMTENPAIIIDIVGVLISAEKRMTASEEKVFSKTVESIKELLDARKVVLLTHSDGSPVNTSILRRFDLQTSTVFKFNSSCLFQEKQDDSLKEYLRENYWLMTEKNLSALIDEMRGIRPLSSKTSTPSPVEHLTQNTSQADKRREKIATYLTGQDDFTSQKKESTKQFATSASTFSELVSSSSRQSQSFQSSMPSPPRVETVLPVARPAAPPPPPPPPAPSSSITKKWEDKAQASHPTNGFSVPPHSSHFDENYSHPASEDGYAESVNSSRHQTYDTSSRIESTMSSTVEETERTEVNSDLRYSGDITIANGRAAAEGSQRSSLVDEEVEHISKHSSVGEPDSKKFKGMRDTYWWKSETMNSDSSHGTVINKGKTANTDKSFSSLTGEERWLSSGMEDRDHRSLSSSVSYLPNGGKTTVERYTVPEADGVTSTVTKTTTIYTLGGDEPVDHSTLNRYSTSLSEQMFSDRREPRDSYPESTFSDRTIPYADGSTLSPGNEGTIRYIYNERTRQHEPHIVSGGSSDTTPTNDDTLRESGVIAYGQFSRTGSEQNHTLRRTLEVPTTTVTRKETVIDEKPLVQPQPIVRPSRETLIDSPVEHTTTVQVVNARSQSQDSSPFNRNSQSRVTRHRLSEHVQEEQQGWNQSTLQRTQIGSSLGHIHAPRIVPDNEVTRELTTSGAALTPAVPPHNVQRHHSEHHTQITTTGDGQRLSHLYTMIDKERGKPQVPTHGHRYENLPFGSQNTQTQPVVLRENKNTQAWIATETEVDATVYQEMQQREQMLRQTTQEVQRDSYIEHNAPTVFRTRPQPSPRRTPHESPQQTPIQPQGDFSGQNTVIIPQELRTPSSPIQYRIQLGQKRNGVMEETETTTVQRWGSEIPPYQQRYPDPTQQPGYEKPPADHLAQIETDEWSTDTEQQAPHPPPHRPGYREVLTETTRTNVPQYTRPIQNGHGPQNGHTVVETTTAETRAPPYTPYREDLRPDNLWGNGDHRPLKEPNGHPYELESPVTRGPAKKKKRVKRTERPTKFGCLDCVPNDGLCSCCPCGSCPTTHNCCLDICCLILAPLFILAVIVTLIIVGATAH